MCARVCISRHTRLVPSRSRVLSCAPLEVTLVLHNSAGRASLRGGSQEAGARGPVPTACSPVRGRPRDVASRRNKSQYQSNPNPNFLAVLLAGGPPNVECSLILRKRANPACNSCRGAGFPARVQRGGRLQVCGWRRALAGPRSRCRAGPALPVARTCLCFGVPHGPSLSREAGMCSPCPLQVTGGLERRGPGRASGERGSAPFSGSETACVCMWGLLERTCA